MATTPATVLAELPLFQGVPPASLAQIEATARHVELPAGETLFAAGEPATEFYVVLAGRLHVVSGDDDVLREIGAGALLGELAVLTATPRSASVRAVRDSELLAIEGRAFEALLEHDPALALALLRQLARQLQQSGGLDLAESRPAVFTVVPLGRGSRVDAFWDELRTAFAALGSVAVLDAAEGRGAPRRSRGSRPATTAC